MNDLVHMTKFEKQLFTGAEWALKAPMWTVLQLSSGIAYLHSVSANTELPLGGLIVVPPNSAVMVLASTLAEANLRGCAIKVSSLSGLLTLAERVCLEKGVADECAPFRQVEVSHPLAAWIAEINENGKALNLASRLRLMTIFAEWLGPMLENAARNEKGWDAQNPKTRLRQLINEIPESEIAELSLSDLARTLCCCERHASRLFHEVCGSSFRRYVAELRLDKACQMLSQGNSKIIDVALESGHSSLALFNYNFKNRFRMTPTEWRARHLAVGGRSVRANGHFSLVPQ
jgi:AraC-like DNA-binding protein